MAEIMVLVVYPFVGCDLDLRKVIPVNCHWEMVVSMILRLSSDLVNYCGILYR